MIFEERKMIMTKLTVVLFIGLFAAGTIQAKTEKMMIQGSVGNLSTIVETPDVEKKGKCPVVILMHGFNDNKNSSLLVVIADKLKNQGIASVRFDFDGHGESDGAFQNMTVPREVDDAVKVYEYVSHSKRFGRVALLGHSQGGVVASMTAGRLGKKCISDVILLAPAAILREDVIRGNTMGVAYDPLNPPEFVQLYNGPKLGREFIRTAFNLPIYETASKYKGAACLIHGTGDRVVPYTCSIHYHEIWKKSKLYLLDGFDHGFSQNMERAANLAVTDLVQKLL